jgi:peroxiredoxin
MKKFLLFVLVSACIGIESFAQPVPGDKAPEIALPNASGNILKLSDLKGKVVLLDFWASWCRPCRQGNRELQSLYKKYKSKGFEIYGVSIDEREGAWLNAVKQDKIEWLQVIDTKAARGSQMMYTWMIQYIPAAFLIDREGKLVAIHPEKDELEKLLKKLLP